MPGGGSVHQVKCVLVGPNRALPRKHFAQSLAVAVVVLERITGANFGSGRITSSPPPFLAPPPPPCLSHPLHDRGRKSSMSITSLSPFSPHQAPTPVPIFLFVYCLRLHYNCP